MQSFPFPNPSVTLQFMQETHKTLQDFIPSNHSTIIYPYFLTLEEIIYRHKETLFWGTL